MQRRTLPIRAAAGFTLVENVFAVTLTSVVVLGCIVLFSRDVQVSRGTMSVQVAQNQAQTLVYAIEGELANARGERPVSTLAQALGSGSGGVITLAASAGFPPGGLACIDRGTNHVERIAYATLESDGRTLNDLMRGVGCTQPASHAANSEVLWDGLAEVLTLGGSPPPELYDGRTLESGGPTYFRGTGAGFSYRLPTDPSGGHDYFQGGELQWGALVDQTPTLDGWCALYFVPRDAFDEATSGVDLNHDGDTTDVFDIGGIHRARWSTSDPAGAPHDVQMGPNVVLQERCHWGADLDGDGFGDPIFLWDPGSGRLHIRLYVYGRNPEGRPAVRRVESMVFLRNSDGG